VVSLAGIHKDANNCYSSSDNPHLTYEAPLHPAKVGAWVAVSARRIVGHLFFKETIK
jgi:hypothetical protein